jgi:hypothetical protein
MSETDEIEVQPEPTDESPRKAMHKPSDKALRLPRDKAVRPATETKEHFNVDGD